MKRFSLGKTAAKQVGDSVRRSERTRSTVQPYPSGYATTPAAILKTPGGGIAAQSSDTCSSASCDLYEMSAAGVLTDTGRNLTVWNIASNAVAGSTYIIALQVGRGQWMAILEDC